MDTYDVNVRVPTSEKQSNLIVITGTPSNVEEAKLGLLAKVEELEQEKVDKQAKSFEIKLDINPDYHPKIIGRKGAVIQQLRKDFDVNVQLPKRGEPNDNIITITGLEDDAEKAKEAIMKIVQEFVSLTTDCKR
jgi:predicted RNA-binding protein YlqC (UPF0109 family)